jgi:hypothetical protein
VSYRAYVYVWLGSFKFFFRHESIPVKNNKLGCQLITGLVGQLSTGLL